MADNQKDDLLAEIKKENERVAGFIKEIDEKIKKTDEKLAKAIISDDISAIKSYKKILQSKNSE